MRSAGSVLKRPARWSRAAHDDGTNSRPCSFRLPRNGRSVVGVDNRGVGPWKPPKAGKAIDRRCGSGQRHRGPRESLLSRSARTIGLFAGRFGLGPLRSASVEAHRHYSQDGPPSGSLPSHLGEVEGTLPHHRPATTPTDGSTSWAGTRSVMRSWHWRQAGQLLLNDSRLAESDPVGQKAGFMPSRRVMSHRRRISPPLQAGGHRRKGAVSPDR
jgi:hypothetical protein